MIELINKLATYRYVLDDESGRFVLVQSASGSTDYRTCIIFDIETQTALIDEDEAVYEELQKLLAENGVPILSRAPLE